MTRSHLRPLAAVAALLTAAGLSACGSDSEGGDAESGGDDKVTITVGNLPGTDQAEPRQLFLDQVEEFEAQNPGITVEAVESEWDPQTFAAQVAGGTLPTVMQVPFTDTHGLIAREQIKDLTPWFEEDADLQKLNEQLLTSAQDTEGHTYGIPSAFYNVAIVINRSLFEQAGLDPDKPFDSWDEFADAARTVTEKTDAAGLGFATNEHLGGWITSALTNSFGDQLETETGDARYEANIDNEATKQALQLLYDLRWTDGAVHDNALMDFQTLLTDFATGKFAMWIGGPSAYGNLIGSLGMTPTDIGALPLPQDDDGLGTLGGGNFQIIRADATDEETDAAVEWVKFRYLNLYLDDDAAVESAKARAANEQPVPSVELPLVTNEEYEHYLDVIAEQVNVPMENFASYYEAGATLAVVPEPAIEGQQIYGLLDPVTQAILTREDADIDQLLADAQGQAEGIVAAGQGG